MTEQQWAAMSWCARDRYLAEQDRRRAVLEAQLAQLHAGVATALDVDVDDDLDRSVVADVWSRASQILEQLGPDPLAEEHRVAATTRHLQVAS